VRSCGDAWIVRGSTTLLVFEVLIRAFAATGACAGELDAVVFGSLDAGAAQYLTTGAKLGFDALDRDGFVALVSLGAGRRNERAADGPRQRYAAAAAAVFGYQWFFDWGVVAAYAGPEVTTELLHDLHGLATLPVQPGLRLQGEIWARPTEETLLQATVVAGSSRDSLWLRVAGGYRLWGAYLGPEIATYMDATGYTKRNIGLHATDLDLGWFNARVSTGLQVESGRRSASPYLALTAWAPW
jgi:hypothetical protein